jgi:GDPmannose 4,6-dehydratase
LSRTALITGITGQDGSYLSELLLSKGYHVHGIARRTSSLSRGRIERIREEAQRRALTYDLHYADMSDAGSLTRIILKVRPDEVYNLAAQAHVAVSFEQPEYTTDVNALGVLRLLEIFRTNGLPVRFYQASSSELFGAADSSPQDENTVFNPASPYAVSKQFGFSIVKNYRAAYGMHGCNGILFNHESPRRGENFVTRKITLGLARIRYGFQDVLSLGNLDASRDWGYAGDYVDAMWRMLQSEKADDYVVATGKAHRVRDFIAKAARVADYEIEWRGEGVDEIGVDRKSGRTLVAVNERYYRPLESTRLVGNAAKARQHLDWVPTMDFEGLVQLMAETDLRIVRDGGSVTEI